jgi:2-dehydro-3-deoxy-D-arabinonate dehydratase
MKLYRTAGGWWLFTENGFFSLSDFTLDDWLAEIDPLAVLNARAEGTDFRETLPEPPIRPLESQEVWAAGVTYTRSRAARTDESDFSAKAYDHVYSAARPELFFKSTPGRCVGSGDPMKLRDDAFWSVPEPELTLVVSTGRKIVGYTLGNDLSSRDIEGANLLYLSQGKIWDTSAAVGPCIRAATPDLDILGETIGLAIRRDGETVFSGEIPVSKLKRTFEELTEYLFRNQRFPHGVFLMTGTGIVPDTDFALRPGDEMIIRMDAVGTLSNRIET